ncbi:MAG TPA: cell division protein FtsZ [Nanoarchaeota archaeon]|nr:cell division protein FtsZ [Candidatus Pacearchaeota archaeon]HIH17452.1 cell division protein FtsZ [Nanoarchaeota archaeon]HIH33965.1 cell division protein FtsZ [Nanoarchaeota archaeon]HIH51744.1 cell division protein FtsZ [Nanoarchaeota archaeon]HIH66684.1 cell division protein FtsZ [Nanoarchaeota archaeon]
MYEKEELRFEIEEPKNIEEVDKELRRFLELQKARVKVFGVGGGGNNTLARMMEVGIKGADMIAVNTDAQDLLYTTASAKILIGKELTFGLGAGSNPKVGFDAAKESESEIRKRMQGANLVFITCGLGGGTGTGAAPVIAEVAKKAGILTIAVVTLPFTIEGKRRWENAMLGLERLEDLVDTLIVIPNDKLLELAPDLPLQTAFKVADEILTNAVKGITELITSPGLVNVDFADIKTVMTNAGVAMIGVGESDSKHRAKEAIEKAINNPLLDIDIEGSSGALVNIVGGKDMSLEEAKEVIEYVSSKLDSDAKFIWGASLSPDMGANLRVMLIMTGVKSPQIFGALAAREEREKGAANELGIEFID